MEKQNKLNSNKISMNKKDASNPYKANIWKMYLFEIFVSLHFFGAVLVPFYTDWGHITFTQILLLQSWFMLWIFILEIPTGTIADFLGRKTSIAIGAIFAIIAPIVYTSKSSFYVFLLGEFLWAISAALFSGADEALIYDSLKKTKSEKESKKVFGRFESFHLAGIMIAAPIGSFIAANLGLRAPMLLGAIPAFFAFIITLTIKEPKTAKTGKKIESKKSESTRYINILKDGVKFFYNHRVLKILAIDMIFIAAIAYFMIWLYQPMLQKAGIGIAYFGLVHAAFALSQILIMNNYSFFEKLFGSKKNVLFFTAFILGAMFILAAITSNAVLIIIAIIIGGGFGLARGPLYSSYLNKHIPSKERATVLSSISMLQRFVLVIINPLIGLLIDASLFYALLILGIAAVSFSFFSRVKEEHLID